MKKGDYRTFCALLDELKKTSSWADIEGNNQKLAGMLGVSERTLYRWLAGDVAVPLTAILLLKLILKPRS